MTYTWLQPLIFIFRAMFFFSFGWLSHRSQELCTAMETSGGGLIAILASEVPCSDRKTGGFTCDKNDDIVIKQ